VALIEFCHLKTIAMIFAPPNHIPVFVLERLELLLALLAERRREFEAFARQIDNRGSRDAVLELAQQCNQYSHELLGQFETMAGRIVSQNSSEHREEGILLSSEPDILHSCQLSEQKIIVAYRRLLNEPQIDEHLRTFLRSQLQGLTCAFMKIKLLNSLLQH
jgi:hypothetical protein